MREQPLVSVIVPNYNYANALPLCLRSLREQTYPNLEVIVVDDCSTDDSPEVARGFGFTVLRTPENGGPAAARNLGAEHASGEILFFLDSDVAAKPDAIANAVELLRSDENIGAVCGNYDPVPLIRDSLLEEYRCLQQSYWLIADEGRITTLYTALLAIPTRVFREVGPFNARLRETENADYGRRLAQRYEVWLSPRVRGVHDHDHDLGTLVRKVFVRTALHIPMFIRKPTFPGGLSSGPRAWISVAALLAVLSPALPVLLGPVLLLVPLAFLALFVAGDLPMHRFVARLRSPLFLLYFVSMHFLLNLVIAVAAVAGVVAWLWSGRFRNMYEVELAR